MKFQLYTVKFIYNIKLTARVTLAKIRNPSSLQFIKKDLKKNDALEKKLSIKSKVYPEVFCKSDISKQCPSQAQ